LIQSIPTSLFEQKVWVCHCHYQKSLDFEVLLLRGFTTRRLKPEKREFFLTENKKRNPPHPTMTPPRSSPFIEDLLDSMGWEGQVGQTAQIDINMLLTEDHSEFRQDLLDHYIGTLGVGSVLNNQNRADPLWTVQDFRKAVIQLQTTAEKFHRPPVIWGLDSVHGANYIYDTIITPQPINLAASFNRSVSEQAGIWASRDTRKAGIPWLFSPLLGLSWNPVWSRVYETFGEDPVLVGTMARAMTDGIQMADDDKTSTIRPSLAAACGKHFVGYSYPHNGHDRAPSWIPIRHLYQYFVLPWKQVSKTIHTVMESYTEVDGVPMAANRQMLNHLLRKELGFDGMLVTDYHEIFNLYEWHHVAKDRTDAITKSLQEGTVDMSMIANEPQDFFAAYETFEQNDQWKERVRTSARRVLELKEKLNMFEESFNLTMDDAKGPMHSDEDLERVLDMTHQSIILVKNDDNVLPLDPQKSLSILVTGPTAHSKSFTTGGWTWQWQGVDSRIEDQWFTYGSSVVEAIQKEKKWHVSYSCGVDILGGNCDGGGDFHEVVEDPTVMEKIKNWVGLTGQDSDLSVERAMSQAASQDVIVVCLGEENYTEKPGDIRGLRLPAGQYELVAGLREAAPNAKIILVYFGGRPRLLTDAVPHVDAVFVGFLPGPLAGEALVDLITGRINPSARLPLTYPKFEDGGGIPYLHSLSDKCTTDTGGYLPHWDNSLCEVQWPFGHGLSYSDFQFDSITLSTTELKVPLGKQAPDLTISVKVSNPSSIPGAFPIMLFTFDIYRSTTPEYKRLRVFEKVWLEANSTKEVTLTIPGEDLRFIGDHDDQHYVYQDGMEFVIGMGPDVDCRTNGSDTRCSSVITIRTDPDYVGACEAACNLWSSSTCDRRVGLDGDHCWKACSSIHFDDHLEMNNDGW